MEEEGWGRQIRVHRYKQVDSEVMLFNMQCSGMSNKIISWKSLTWCCVFWKKSFGMRSLLRRSSSTIESPSGLTKLMLRAAACPSPDSSELLKISLFDLECTVLKQIINNFFSLRFSLSWFLKLEINWMLIWENSLQIGLRIWSSAI